MPRETCATARGVSRDMPRCQVRRCPQSHGQPGADRTPSIRRGMEKRGVVVSHTTILKELGATVSFDTAIVDQAADAFDLSRCHDMLRGSCGCEPCMFCRSVCRASSCLVIRRCFAAWRGCSASSSSQWLPNYMRNRAVHFPRRLWRAIASKTTWPTTKCITRSWIKCSMARRMQFARRPWVFL